MLHFEPAKLRQSRFLQRALLSTSLLFAPSLPVFASAPQSAGSIFTAWLPISLFSTAISEVLSVSTSASSESVLPLAEVVELARSEVRASRNDAARELLTRWLEANSGTDNSDLAIAHDLAGFAAWRSRDYSEAIHHLQIAHELQPGSRTAPWRLAWLADAAFRTGDFQSTIMWGAQSLELAPREFSSFTARAVYYRAHACVKENPDPRTLAEFLDMHPEYPERRDAEIELLQAWLHVGNKRQAIKVADKLIWDEPWTTQSAFARQIVRNDDELSALAVQLSPAERFKKAQEYRGLRQWQSARVELLLLEGESLKGFDGSLPLSQIYFELARTAMEAGEYQRAHDYFSRLDPFDVPGSQAWEVLREHGYNLSRMGVHQEALTMLRRSAELRGGQAGIDLLYEFLFDLGHFSEARTLAREVSRSKRPDAFSTAYLDYLSSDFGSAIAAFDRVAQSDNDHLRHRANYWAARSELHLGKVRSARERFERIVRVRPHDYYGILAKSRLADLDAAGLTSDVEPGSVELRRLPGRIHWNGETDHRIADFEVVAASADELTAYSPELPPAAPLQDSIAPWVGEIPELQTVLELYRIGADEEARKVYRAVVDEVAKVRAAAAPSGNRPARLSGYLWGHSIDNRPEKRGWWGIPLSTLRYQLPDTDEAKRALVQRQLAIRRGGDALTEGLIQIGRALEDHHIVRRLVQRERGLSGNPPTDGPDRIDWLEAYPRPFPSTVIELTRQYNMNPYVLWALIIVESDMNPDAISRADAYGLMQVIPKTGDRIAHELKENSFGIHELLDPHYAIRYGAWYMGELIHKFHNQESLGLASYNTGPHRVARWLDWRGSELDYDEFLETIPFPGAHNYHKRIIRYAATYQMLYEKELKFYIGLNLDSTYDPKINF